MNKFDAHFLYAIVLLAIVVLLQVFLSKRTNKWLGLILPALTFVASFMYPFIMLSPPEGLSITFAMQMLGSWLIVNIPTVILLAIYCVCRKSIGIKQSKEERGGIR